MSNNNFKKFLILGGSSGIGEVISRNLLNKQFKVFCLSRKGLDLNNENLTNIKFDLGNIDEDFFCKLIKENLGFDGVCFSQRFRSENSEIINYSEEFKVMVLSIANFMNAYIKLSEITKIKFSNIALITSTYSERIGLNQNWSYHTSKSSQLALVKFYASRSNSKYMINAFSPATYIKRGADQYWKNNSLTKKWQKSPNGRLFKVDEVAKPITDYLIESSMTLNGNNIILDGGLHNLYPDQLI